MQGPYVTMGSEIQWPIVASNDTLCSRQDWTRSTSLPWNSSICSMRNTSLYVSFLVSNTPLFQWGINRRHTPAFIRRTIVPMKSFLLGSVWSRLPHGSSILSSLQQGKRQDLISKAECKAKKHQKDVLLSCWLCRHMSTHVDTCPHMSTHVHTCPQQIAECRQDLSPRSSIGKLTRSHLQKAVASAVTRSQLRLIVQLPCLACLACGPCSPLVTPQMAPHSSPNLSALCKRSFCDSFPLRFPLRLVKIASCAQLFSAKAERTDFAFKLCAKRRSKFCKQQNKWHQIACLSGSFHYSTCTLSIWAGDSTSKTA